MLFLTQLFGVTGNDADLSSGIEQVKRILGRWLSLGFHRRSHDFPETMISTRRFFRRHSAVLFSATRFSMPRPCADSELACRPWLTR